MSCPSPSTTYSPPVFTAGFLEEDEEEFEQLDQQFSLSLDSPQNEYVFANDLADEDDEDAGFQTSGNVHFHHHDAHDDKAASMRSVHHRDTAIAFDPMMRRGAEAFMETSLFDTIYTKDTPTFVVGKVLESPTFSSSSGGFFPALLPSSSKDSKVSSLPSSPLSPSAYVSKIDVPEKQRDTTFYSLHPAFTSHENASKIMDTVKTALATLNCEYDVQDVWTLDVRVLMVAEEVAFAVHIFQLRGVGSSTQYEIEVVRRSGDEVVFADLADHLRALCSDIDDDGALSMMMLTNKTLDPWMDATQDLTGRRYAIKETEAATLLDELNCEFLHTEALYHVARSVKNHCRHKGNRKLFLSSKDHQKSLLKGLKWMLSDSEPLSRFALFAMHQFAQDEELCMSFFATPYDKSTMALQLDTLVTREQKNGKSKFTRELVEAVQRSALFAST